MSKFISNQIISIVTVLTCTMSSTTFGAVGTQIVTDRCNNEMIDMAHKSQIQGRWDWSKKCSAQFWDKPTGPGLAFMNFLYQDLPSELAAWTVWSNPGPYFPIYVSSDYSQTWPAPRDGGAPCGQPPYDWKIILCQGGCLIGSQKILFSDGYYSASEALALQKSDVITLSDEATVEDLRLEVNKVDAYHTDATPNPINDYLTIITTAGSVLKITPNHPLVNGDGIMVRAEELKVGDELLHVSGRHDTITAIQKGEVSTKVVNLEPASIGETSKVYVVNGYLSGSISQQRRDLAEINRVLFREQLNNLTN